MDKSKSCKHNIYKVTHIKKKEKSSCLKFGEKKMAQTDRVLIG